MQSSLEIIWPHGRNSVCAPEDGRHFILPGYSRPVSIGQVEAFFLHNLAKLIGAERGFEIGTAFGYSSFWLGHAIAKNHPTRAWFGSLDNWQEGSIGTSGLKFAKEWAERLSLSNVVKYLTGNSPEDVLRFVSEPVDIAFIDGNHNGDQPLKDYKALRELLTKNGVIVWHDIEPRYGVNLAISEAIKDGWSVVTFPTSCRIGIGYRTFASWNAALDAFMTARRLELV